jgi:tight adherence protein B
MITAIPSAWLRALAVVLLGAGSGLVILAFVRAESASLRAWFARREAALAIDLAFLRAPITAARVLHMQGLALSVGALCALLGYWFAASLLWLLVLSVLPGVQARRLVRTTALEAQLDTWLVALASGLRATPALGEAIQHSLALTGAPLRDELALLMNEVHVGTPLDAAMGRAAARVRSRTFQSALSALRIGRTTGGDLSSILERSAATLREMARLEGVVRTKTAEARAQGFVLAALPLPMLALLHHLSPHFLDPLFYSTRGHLVLAGAGLLWAASLALARVILHVDL